MSDAPREALVVATVPDDRPPHPQLDVELDIDQPFFFAPPPPPQPQPPLFDPPLPPQPHPPLPLHPQPQPLVLRSGTTPRDGVSA
jgi:hypothetical protein